MVAAVGAVVIALMVYSSMSLGGYRVEVCKEFQGQRACRTAAGSTEAAALRTANDNACAQISSGMTDSMNCQASDPISIKWIEKGR